MPVQLIASVSSGVTRFILGLHLCSSRPGLWDLPLLSTMTRRRVFLFLKLSGSSEELLQQTVILLFWQSNTLTTAVVSTVTTEKEDTAIHFVHQHVVTFIYGRVISSGLTRFTDSDITKNPVRVSVLHFQLMHQGLPSFSVELCTYLATKHYVGVDIGY